MATDPNLGFVVPEQGMANVVPVIAEGLRVLSDAIVNGIPGATLNAELISAWKLGEASGTRADSVGTNHLSDNNTVTQALGKIGNAAQFTLANSEYLSIADNATLSTGNIDFSFAAWVYFDTLTSFHTIAAKGTGLNTATEWFLDYSTSTSRFRFGVTNGVAAFTIVSANTFGAATAGVWYLVVVRHDSVGNTITISVNNQAVPDSAAFTTGSWDSTQPFTLGALAGGASFHNGRIDAAGFWKKVLSLAEIDDLYNGGVGREFPFS